MCILSLGDIRIKFYFNAKMTNSFRPKSENFQILGHGLLSRLAPVLLNICMVSRYNAIRKIVPRTHVRLSHHSVAGKMAASTKFSKWQVYSFLTGI